MQSTDNFIDHTSLSRMELVGNTWSSRAIPAGVDEAIDIATMNFEIPIWYTPPAKVKKLGVVKTVISSVFDETGSLDDGVIDNRGIEIMVDYVVVNTGDFNFTPTLTFSKNTNTVVDIGTAEDAGLIEDNFGLQYIIARNDLEYTFGSNIVSVYALGHSMLSFYGYRTDGIVQTIEEGLEAGLQGEAAQPGEIKYVDLNGDGIVDLDGDTEDREIIGNPEPDFMGSLNLNFIYKNFDLSLFMYGVYGNDILDLQKFNRPSDQVQRWTSPEEGNNEFPSLRNNRGWPLVSDYYITDGSYLRIQNLSFGYTTPVRKLRISSLKVYLNIYNLSYHSLLNQIIGFDAHAFGQLADGNNISNLDFPFDRL